MTIQPLDATTAPTAPFTPTPQHQALAGLAGRWSGDTHTIYGPGTPEEDCSTTATIEALLGGRWIRIDYQGTAMGQPHAGVLTLGFHNDIQTYEAALIDSFHTGTMMLISVGKPRADGVVDVLGSYGPAAEPWGWRTTLRRVGEDELVLESFNIMPGGQEFPAVLTRLRRA